MFDNFSVFDSAEDGVNPQGVAVWLLANQRMGWAVVAPNYFWGTAYGLSVAGQPVPSSLVVSWFLHGQFVDRLCGHVTAAGVTLPPSLREFVAESNAQSVLPNPWISYTITYTSSLGTALGGGAWYTE